MTAKKIRSKTEKAKASLHKVHPESRKASQANKTIAREKRLERNKNERNKMQKQPLVNLFKYFQESVNSMGDSLTDDQITSIVETWANRNQDRITVFEQERNSKQHSKKTTKQELLETIQRNDLQSLRDGLSTYFINCSYSRFNNKREYFAIEIMGWNV